MLNFLQQEIENQKRIISEARNANPDKKYLKVSELTKIVESKDEDQSQNIINLSKRKIDDIITNSEDRRFDKIPPRKEIMAKLRERDHPVRLFAESDYEAYQRLKSIEMIKPELDKGYRNDFQIAMDKNDQETLDSIVSGTDRSSKSDKYYDKLGKDSSMKTDVNVSDDGTTLEDIQKLAKDLSKGNTDQDSIIILKIIKFLVKQWGRQLNSREFGEKASMQGKMAQATHTQTVTYLKPLMARLRAKILQYDILESLTDIMKRLLEREYIKANEIYLQMAIGNAPWPIGVTMPGIHVRTGRERIASKHVAHVLNDETQRKYIQGLKRLMTFCQRAYPTVPSKSIEYVAEDNIKMVHTKNTTLTHVSLKNSEKDSRRS